MSRVQAHRVVFVVALTLVLAGTPAAWAAPLSPSAATTGSWFDAAASWFAGLFDVFAFGGADVPESTPTATTSAITYGSGSGGGSQTNSGSCIDPLGGNRCNV